MQKRWLIVYASELQQLIEMDAREPRVPAPARNRNNEDAPRRREVANNVGNWGTLACGSFESMRQAEEWVEEALRKEPGTKFMIFEAAAFLETVPSPMLKKGWNDKGELQLA